MNKKISNISAIVLIAALAGWLGYKYFFANNDSDYPKGANYYSSNSCWIYHEYVYRVDFDDENLISFFFIRNDDGTFSPSRSDSSGNQVTGNGFILNSGGACVTTRKIYEPWILDDEGKYLLKELIDGWMDLQEGVQERTYLLTGQTVALFVILSDPKEFIEYSTFKGSSGEEQYGIIYPERKTNFSGLQTDYQNKKQPGFDMAASLFVLKTNFDESVEELPSAKTTTDHIKATLARDSYLNNITVQKGDEFFNEGSSMLNENGQWLGILHYTNNKWQLISTSGVDPVKQEYPSIQLQEEWSYQKSPQKWVRIWNGADKDSGSFIPPTDSPPEKELKVNKKGGTIDLPSSWSYTDTQVGVLFSLKALTPGSTAICDISLDELSESTTTLAYTEKTHHGFRTAFPTELIRNIFSAKIGNHDAKGFYWIHSGENKEAMIFAVIDRIVVTLNFKKLKSEEDHQAMLDLLQAVQF